MKLSTSPMHRPSVGESGLPGLPGGKLAAAGHQARVPVMQDEQGSEISCSLHLLVMRMMLCVKNPVDLVL